MMNNENTDFSATLPEFRHVNDGVFLRQNDYYKKFLYTDILWVESSGSYSYIHLRDKSKLIVAHRLKVVESKLPGSHFIRVHRGFILSLFDIDSFVGNSLRIGEKWFPIGRNYRKLVIASFNVLDHVRECSDN